MKNKIILGLSLAIGVIAFLYIVNSYSFDEVFTPFRNASLWAIGGFILASFLITVVLTKRWQTVNKALGIDVPFWDLYLYRFAGYCISYITPGPRVGGEPVMASLLKKRGVDYTKSLSAMVIDKTIDAAMVGIVFIIGVLVLLVGFALPDSVKNGMILAAIIFASLIGYFFYRVINGKQVLGSLFRVFRLHTIHRLKRFEQKLLAFEKVMIRFYTRKKRSFLNVVLWELLLFPLMWLEYTSAMGILGIGIDAMGVFLLVTLTAAAMLLPIPAALGSMEAGQISALAAKSIKTSLGLSLAIIIRIRDLIYVFFGFLLLFYFGFDIRKVVKKMFRKYVRVNKNVKVYLRE